MLDKKWVKIIESFLAYRCEDIQNILAKANQVQNECIGLSTLYGWLLVWIIESWY